MRASPTAEVSVIRGRRSWRQRLLVRLFGRLIYRIAYSHISRALETSVITPRQFEDVTYYMELDLARCGRLYRGEGQSPNPGFRAENCRSYPGYAPTLPIIKPTTGERMFR